MSELTAPFQTMSLAPRLPPTDTADGRIQLSLDYLRDPQATALRALVLTPEDIAVTSNIAYNPPPDVVDLQTMSCHTGGIRGYFHSAIVSIMEPHVDEDATEFRREVDFENRGIIKATRVFMATVPEHLKMDESTYTFSNRILHQLLPVARRAFELLRENPESSCPPGDYLELRTAVITFIHHFKLPRLFCDALGLALEVFPCHELSRLGLPPRVQITGPGPANPVKFPFVYHSGMVKEIVGVFNHPRDLCDEDYLLLLRSPSRNPSHPQLLVFELEEYTKFPGILEQCLQDDAAHFLFLQTGQIDRWRGKGWADFRIRGVASAPHSSRDTLTYIFAESTDGEIAAQWWHKRECERKFGAPKVWPSLYIHEIKTGQINLEVEHYEAMSWQLNLLDQEREERMWHSR
jgi:hypothetical protein